MMIHVVMHLNIYIFTKSWHYLMILSLYNLEACLRRLCPCSKCGFLLQKAIRRPLFSPFEALCSSFLWPCLMHKNLQDIQTESVNCAAAQLELPVFVLHSVALLFPNFESNRVAPGLLKNGIRMSLTGYSYCEKLPVEKSDHRDESSAMWRLQQ